MTTKHWEGFFEDIKGLFVSYHYWKFWEIMYTYIWNIYHFFETFFILWLYWNKNKCAKSFFKLFKCITAHANHFYCVLDKAGKTIKHLKTSESHSSFPTGSNVNMGLVYLTGEHDTITPTELLRSDLITQAEPCELHTASLDVTGCTKLLHPKQPSNLGNVTPPQTIRLMALTYSPAGGPAITLCFNSPSFRVSHFIFPGTGRLHGDA